MTRRSRAFIYGCPIGHSISPAIHNAAFEARQLRVTYEARKVSSSDLAAGIERLRHADVLGANITVPHKEAVLGLVDQIGAEVRLIGSVNTIHNRSGKLVGSNTDAAGFGRSLEQAGVMVERQSTLLLGAGGSARAVAYALLSAGVRDLIIANRTIDRAAKLASSFEKRFPRALIRP